MFKLESAYQPAGDQPQAIESLIQGLQTPKSKQVLLGVTGSGKTYTVANVIEQTKLPTLVISHNKTLAAQLYQEFRDFFPNNAVCYFVSYYDYYQPEAYIPQTDTYIEKETQINEDIDKLRLAATANLLARQDVIVVASVSCIYNLGSPVNYQEATIELMPGMLIDQKTLMTRLQQLQYKRSDMNFVRGTYRLRGDFIDLYPAYQDFGYRIEWGSQGQISQLSALDILTGTLPTDSHENPTPMGISDNYRRLIIYPARHYNTQTENRDDIFTQILSDLDREVAAHQAAGRLLEAQRLKQRVTYDMEMLKEVGFVNGIENYSRYFDGRHIGDPPFSLIDFFNHSYKDWLCVIDESHITLPQIRGMYNGDRSRKQTLIDFGFRMNSALDNRPLKFDEFQPRLDHTLYVSATPADWEISDSANRVIHQLIRPTGLLDPIIHVRPIEGQIADLLARIQERIARGERVLVLTLTKRTAEDLSKYLQDHQIKVNYLHSEVETLERTDILASLRQGEYDVIVGVNLLREGIDLPEVSLVVILDADKQGFLRSTTSLMQIMGRAARHHAGEVVMYADKVTDAMQTSMTEVARRRKLQEEYNQAHGITPKTVSKPIRARLIEKSEDVSPAAQARNKNRKFQASQEVAVLLDLEPETLTPAQAKQATTAMKRHMTAAARDMNFELAAALRDKISQLVS